MYISKRAFVRIISFLTAAILVVGIAAALNMNTSEQLKQSLTQTMTRNAEELSASLDNLSTTLTKSRYAESAQMLEQLSSKLWSDAASAKLSLSQLPVAELHLENTYKFLSQVGNYSKSLAKRCANGETLTAKDRENLAALGEYASRLADNMWTVEERITNGELSFEKAASEMQGAENSDEPMYITEGFTDFEEGYDNYPTLIYDGPFSDHILEKEPVMLKNAEEVTIKQALKKAEAACNTTGLTHSESGDEQGKMPSFVFSKDNVTAAVTKKGGLLCYMSNYRGVANRTLTAAQAVQKAKEYLKKLGIENLTDTYYEIYNNVCMINFAAVQDDVTMYTDLIKVSVAMDNGDIIGYDARGYITNHTVRTLKSPALTQSEAQAKLSKQLVVTSAGLAVIPSAGQNELYCYEFSCRADDGRNILVYINTETGDEEQILLLQISENGTLTV